MLAKQGDNIVDFPIKPPKESEYIEVKVRSGSKNKTITRVQNKHDYRLIQSLGGEGSWLMQAMQNIADGYMLLVENNVKTSNLNAGVLSIGHENASKREEMLLANYSKWWKAVDKRKYRETSQGKFRRTEREVAMWVIAAGMSIRECDALLKHRGEPGYTREILTSNLKECLRVYCDVVGWPR